MRGIFLILICLTLISGACQAPTPTQTVFFPANHPAFQFEGRFLLSQDSSAQFAWSASKIQVQFSGSFCQLHLQTSPLPGQAASYPPEVWFRVQIDEQAPFLLAAHPDKSTYLLADSLAPGSHSLSIFRRTEAETGLSTFEGLTLAPGNQLSPPPRLPQQKLLFFGNSITCGYGNEGANRDCPFSPATENAWESFAAIAARTLAARHQTICFSGRGVYQNYGGSREGTLPVMWDRYFPGQQGTGIDPMHYQPDWVIINLGTNDFAQGEPEPAAFLAAYRSFVQRLRTAYPSAKMLLLSGPMMSGEPLLTLQGHLQTLQAELADPKLFLLGLTTQGPLGYGCDWHPNLAQHQLNAAELVAFLEKH